VVPILERANYLLLYVISLPQVLLVDWFQMLLYLHGVVILLKNIQLVLNGWTARGRQHIVVNCLDVIVNNKAIAP